MATGISDEVVAEKRAVRGHRDRHLATKQQNERTPALRRGAASLWGCRSLRCGRPGENNVPAASSNGFREFQQVAFAVPVEKPAISGMLLEGSRALGLSLTEAQADALSWLAGELARWSSRMNLTAILDPIEMADKHILDSLAVLRALEPGPLSVLDAGSGAGFPGLPLAIAREDLSVTLVDSVAKKVGFLKHSIAQLGLAPRVRALHTTLRGNPASEGLDRVDVAVSRALADPVRWAALAAPYVKPGGTLVVMAGGDAQAVPLAGWTLSRVERLRLPLSGDGRTVVTYRKAA